MDDQGGPEVRRNWPGLGTVRKGTERSVLKSGNREGVRRPVCYNREGPTPNSNKKEWETKQIPCRSSSQEEEVERRAQNH